MALLATALTLPAWALSDAELQARLDTRFKGDRTGACVVAAVIDGDQVQRLKTCAGPRRDAVPGFDSLFEIGSVSKTMTAFLVAELVRQGRWSLDDPLQRHLPPGTELPRQGERQILVRDVLTHRSGLPGLPPGFSPKNPADPYAELSEATLLAAAARAPLSGPIGSRFEYSNFAMMLMSLAVARASGGDFENALVERLFVPLRMDASHVERPRSPRPRATGHLPSGQPTSDWHIGRNLAGVGMVRATLDDMVAYARAHLGAAEGPLRQSLDLTRQPLAANSGMNWLLASVAGHDLVMHEGGTGGFSSLVLLEPKARRGVVLLCDTALADLGGLGALGSALLDIEKQAPKARQPATPSEALLAAMVGDFELGGLGVRIWRDGPRLMARADGQSAFELKYDSAGDFYPEAFSALLSPQLAGTQVNRATWRQGGGATELVRKGSRSAPTASNPRWKDLAGEYRLAPQFNLRVFEEGGVLKVQGTGQPSIAAELTGPDTLEIKAVGAVLQFQRDAAGRVTGAVLRQNGQVLEGRKAD